jgi:hypothetical protein
MLSQLLNKPKQVYANFQIFFNSFSLFFFSVFFSFFSFFTFLFLFLLFVLGEGLDTEAVKDVLFNDDDEDDGDESGKKKLSRKVRALLTSTSFYGRKVITSKISQEDLVGIDHPEMFLLRTFKKSNSVENSCCTVFILYMIVLKNHIFECSCYIVFIFVYNSVVIIG